MIIRHCRPSCLHPVSKAHVTVISGMSDIISVCKGGCGGGVAALAEWKKHSLFSTFKLIVIAVYGTHSARAKSFMRENSK